MKHRPRLPEQDDLLRPRLVDMIDMRHELVKLAELIDWDWFDGEWGGFFPSTKGRPATDPRLVAGLMYLQHAYGLSDEAVVARWVENPYFQHFTGETFFQHRPPIDPTSLTRWRKRIGEEGAEWLLTKTIEAGRAAGVIDGGSLSCVAVDTTVMEKNIAHPTDARLYDKARRKLVALAREGGLELRQSYARKGPRLAAQAGRYAHARQFKRMRKALRTLKGYTGRVLRDVRRQLADVPNGSYRDRLTDMLALVSRLLHQEPRGSGKLYALHEPAVDCISKGKARVRYEFGCKVSLATTLDRGFVVGMRSLPGNPYDGHTLDEALEQVTILTGTAPEIAVVDRGYRGHGVTKTRVLISGTRRGLTPTLARLLRRRSAIEPEIGHMKSDGRLARCPLKGTIGDAIFAVLCGCGHNIRKILAHLRALLLLLLTMIRAQATWQDDHRCTLVAA
ncbi:IS5 family transposase [Rhodovulum adriaticum]|uniref:IS4 family transposase n=1 Tax=Rhodovulum adriaticum TaxID=35804 RepID=A0A4R2NFC3_RHOAD|nr:IS5 family transposase [Rhodovulum adriaticum]MBK1637240.1 IS5/IS1182 family transposase [Rhodovulum adriaticum]TCP19991.1 IS4 family transposase [Rhodovulum adriaticum]TCP20004.1 IS5 family transposase [Rhodovulum adriaticum]